MPIHASPGVYFETYSGIVSNSRIISPVYVKTVRSSVINPEPTPEPTPEPIISTWWNDLELDAQGLYSTGILVETYPFKYNYTFDQDDVFWYPDSSTWDLCYLDTNGVTHELNLDVGVSLMTLGLDGKIWFIDCNTPDFNICYYDPSNSQFKRYENTSADNAYSDKLLFDSNGNVYYTDYNNSTLAILNPETEVITDTGLDLYSSLIKSNDGKFWFVGYHCITYYDPETTESRNIAAITSSKIVSDNNGKIWMYLMSTKELSYYDSINDNIVSIAGTHALNNTFLVDLNNKIWYIDSVYIPEQDLTTKYLTSYDIETDTLTKLENTSVNGCLFMDNSGNLWFNNSDNSIGYYNIETDHLEKIMINPADVGFYFDSDNNMFMIKETGTSYVGELVARPAGTPFAPPM